jgi:hypothetical protein
MFLRGFGDGPGSETEEPTPTNRLVGERFEPDYFPDDDDYVEYTVEWVSEDGQPESHSGWERPRHVVDEPVADENMTEPLSIHVEHPLHAPAETWHGGPVETWHSLLQDEPQVDDDPDTEPERIVAAEPDRAPEPVPSRNGFHHHRDGELQFVPPVAPRGGRHARVEDRDGDAGTYGRHSMRFRD